MTREVGGQIDGYAYVPGTNRLSQITGPNAAGFSYDASGNITAVDNFSFIYNQNNRLIRVEEGTEVLGEYTYNGLGQRVLKDADGQVTVFLYDFDGNIIAEGSTDGTVTSEYLYMGSNRIAMADAGTGHLYYYNNNYLGTPLLITDSDGNVVWDAEYLPFGQAVVSERVSVVNNFRFAGQYFDQESGLHYNYFRYYDPRTGRSLTPDPIGLSGGINLYAYADNNPINIIDPYGLDGFVATAGKVAVTTAKGAATVITVGVTGVVSIVGSIVLGMPSSTAGPEDDMIPLSYYDNVRALQMSSQDDVIVGPWPGSGIDTRTAQDIEGWRQQCIELYTLCIEENWPGNCGACLNKCRAQREWPFEDCPAERSCR